MDTDKMLAAIAEYIRANEKPEWGMHERRKLFIEGMRKNAPPNSDKKIDSLEFWWPVHLVKDRVMNNYKLNAAIGGVVGFVTFMGAALAAPSIRLNPDVDAFDRMFMRMVGDAKWYHHRSVASMVVFTAVGALSGVAFGASIEAGDVACSEIANRESDGVTRAVASGAIVALIHTPVWRTSPRSSLLWTVCAATLGYASVELTTKFLA